MNRTRFIESISGVFHIYNEDYTHILSVSASALALRSIFPIDIPYRARITNRTRFIESISGVFHIYNEEYTHILSVSASALALDCTLKLFTVDLMRCANCESNDPLTRMASR